MSMRLAATFRRAARKAEPGAGDLRLTLADLLQLHGQASACVLLMLSALLSAIPIAGLGTVLSFLILALAWRWHRSHDAPQLPQRLEYIALNGTWSRRCLHIPAWIYRTSGAFLRTRWTCVCGSATHAWWGAWIAVMGVVILLPLPFGNVLPSLSLVLLSLGWMFRDGLALLASAVVGTGAIGFSLAMAHLLLQGAGFGLDWLRQLV